MSKIRIVGFGLLVVVTGTACGLAGAAGESGDEAATPEATEAPMFPVSINQGLASLDSYRMTYATDMIDSTTQQETVTTLVMASDREADATYTRSETSVTGAEMDPEASGGVQEQYSIGNQFCQVSDGLAELTTVSEAARVMMDLMSQAVSFNPVIEDPVFAGEGTVNGVPVRKYTFELRSLGATSDVEVSRSDGSYAIAVDGDYLVHYLLDLELRTGAEGEPEAQSSILHLEVSLEDINQPVEIVFPAECQAAELNSE